MNLKKEKDVNKIFKLLKEILSSCNNECRCYSLFNHYKSDIRSSNQFKKSEIKKDKVKMP